MAPPADKLSTKRVFVIHGRNVRLRDSMFAFLHALKLEPIEWMQAIAWTRDPSAYVGQILETAFQRAQAAVVLLSGDDEARLRPELQNGPNEDGPLRLQPRPNVLFEAGIAFGYMPERTILIDFAPATDFSDIAGRHTVRMNNSAESRHMLAERLKLSGCVVDTSGGYWLTAGDFSETPRQATNAQSRLEHGLDPTVVNILKVLADIGHHVKANEIAQRVEQPIAKVRVVLTDLVASKMVSYLDAAPTGRIYSITDEGVRKLMGAGLI